MSRRPPIKKPTGSRPLRSASGDSTVSAKSQHPITAPLQGESRKLSKSSALYLGDVDEAVEDPETFYGNRLTDSPTEEDLFENKDDGSQYLDIVPPHPDRPGTSAGPPSPSRVRWDGLRRHIMHHSPSVAPPLAPSLQSIPKPFASPLPVGGRPGTPKSSRFPRLGMRQVVDTAREIAVDDMRKFALELERACAQLRAPDFINYRSAREGSVGGSALSLSLPHSTGAASTIPSTNWSKQSASTIAPPRPSVLTLLRTLEQYEASLLHLPRTLPRENQVLSALLVPFVSSDPSEREQDYALRAFSLIIKTWRTDSPEVRQTLAPSMSAY